MRALFVNEKFSDESDPVSDMGIGIAFGFGFDMVGLEKNDGKHNLYVNEQFIKKYCRQYTARNYVLNEDFYARYKSGPVTAKCSFYFRTTSVYSGNKTKTLYFTAGNAGSRGFNGAEQSRKYLMGSSTIKNVLGQLYNHMLKLE